MTDLIFTVGAEVDGLAEATKALDKMEQGHVGVVKAMDKLRKEHKVLERALKKGDMSAQAYANASQRLNQELAQTAVAALNQSQAVERTNATMQRGQRVTLETGSAQQVLRQRFLETANSIAVLDGPLGGVASRFSSFGVLVGRTGVALATAGVAFTAFSVAATRGIRSFVEFEVQLATIENRLGSTSTQVRMTSSQIANLATSISQATLASERDLLRASAQMLTFGNITTDVFEQVLRSATDLAASGFGTVESAASMLSRALEDPRQSLTSLSRSGITFTRQQREMIISMIDAGRQAEAMALVLEQVNRQVGGAAEAQARGTYAGDFDTIGQAVQLASRQLGEFVLETLRVGRVIEAVGRLSDRFIDLSTETEAEQLAELTRRATALREALDGNIAQRAAVSFRELGVVGGDLEKRLRQVESLINNIVNAPRLDSALGAITRRETAIDSLQAELDIRREVLFLTEDQQRVQRQLAAQGFGAGGLDAMQDEMKEVVEAMLAFGSSQEDIMRTVDRMVDRFQEASQIAGDFNQLLQDERTASAILSNLTNLTQQNEMMELINQNLLEGVSLAEARSNAEAQLLDNLLEMGDAALERLGLDRSAVELLRDQVEASRLLVGQNAELTAERRQLDQMRGFIENIDEENRLLAVQLGFMRDGVDEAEARRMAEVEIEKQLLRQEQALLILQSALRELNELEAERLGLINAQLNAIETREAQRAEVASISGSRRGSSGGGGATGPNAIEQLQQQLDREIQLLQVFGDQRLEMEARFRVYDAMSQAGIQLSEDQKQALVDQIMLTHELKRAEEDRIETQRKLEQAQERAAQRMTDLFMAATQGGDAFKRTLANIIQELARMAAMRAFQSIIGGSSGGLLTSLFGFSDGGVFQGGNVKAFAKGGVVDGPTMFPMKGATGLMGEAGPEAIIPLKRARDGSLGVQGGVTNAVSVTYAPQISVKGSGQEVAELRQEIAKMNAEAPARIISTIQKAQKKRVL